MNRKKRWITYGSFALVLLAAYFINVEVQTYLGKRALADTGLEVLELNAAMTRAREESKLVLADVSAIWCPTCRKLDREIFGNDAVKKAIRQGFVFARLEYESEEGKKFMEQHGLRGFPNLLVLDSNGEMVKKLPITFDPDVFRESLLR